MLLRLAVEGSSRVATFMLLNDENHHYKMPKPLLVFLDINLVLLAQLQQLR